MRTVSARAWALVLLSAFLQFLIFPIAGILPAWRAALGWFALVPLLLALLFKDREGNSLRPLPSAALGYLCGVLWYLGNCYWIYQTMYLYGGLPKPVAFIILILFALYLGLYHALFALLLSLLRRLTRTPLHILILVPFLWVTVELARARITGFPWDLLGNSQVDNLFLTRLAPVTGVLGISFVIAAINAAITALWLDPKKGRLIAIEALVAIALLQLGNSLTWVQQADTTAPTHLAVLMQENLEVGAMGREVAPLTLPDELSAFANATQHPIPVAPLGSHPAPDLIVWPEAPSHLRSYDPLFRQAMSTLALNQAAPLIIGSLGVDFDQSAPRGYFEYDSASIFNAAGTYTGRYDKIHLVPWGEFVPFKQLFAFASKLTEGVGDMDRGHDRNVFRPNQHAYGVFICYESIFGDEVRQFVKNGAEVLVNISDDGWYGDTGAPWQHLNMVRMRAIENHRWILRSTNTGITSAIDPRGRLSAAAPRHTRAAYAMLFNYTQGTTFYTRHGDWFAWLCALLTLALLGFSLKPRMH